MPSSSALPNDTSASAHFAALRDYLSRLEESAAQRERATQNLESELETAKRRLLEQERRAEALASQREEEQQDYEYQMNSMRRRLAAAASSRTAAPQTSVLSGRSSQATVTGTVEKRASSARSSPKKKTKPRSKSAAASAHASASEGDSDDTDRNDAIVELRETRRRLRAAQFDRDLVKDERDALQSKVYAAQQEIIAAVSKSKQSHKDLVESRSSAKALELRLHGLEEQLKAAKSAAVDVADVRASAASFEAALKAARDDAARKSRQFRELAAEKKVVDEQFQELDQQCKSLKDRVKQLSSHNMRLQERIITLTAEAEALAEEKSALMTKQTASTKPAPVLNARSPLDAHVATNVTAPSALKTRSKSPHVVSPASSVHAAVAEIKPKPSEAEAKKDALVRSLQARNVELFCCRTACSFIMQIAAKQQETLVASLREVMPCCHHAQTFDKSPDSTCSLQELDRKEKAASAMRKARTDLERRADSNAAAHSQLTQARAEHETLSRDRDLAMSKSAKLQKELIALTHRLEHSDKQIAALTSVIEFVAEKLLLGVEESLSRMHIAAQAAAESAGDNASLGGLDVRAVARQLVASKGDLRSSVQNSMGSLAAGLKNPVDVSGVQQMLLTWLEQRVSLAGSVDSSQDDSMTSRQSGGGQGLIEDVMRMHKELFA
jgi:DNA repair exonuclease SbcCD ATPase subunit